MRILICNERFLFRFGVDRVLLLLGHFWKQQGHEIVMMGNRLDAAAVGRCSDRFIPIPMAENYFNGNEFTLQYLKKHWKEWFTPDNSPDVAFIAGWPFYQCIGFLRKKCGYAFFHDHGKVPTDGMGKGQVLTQLKLATLRRENLRFSSGIIAVSKFIEETQSIPDTDGIIPTSSVLHGADHLDLHLWGQADLGIEKSGALEELRKFQSEGYRILFQPGRWEAGNYKNSPASFELARYFRDHQEKVKIVVLSSPKEMAIPKELEDMYYCPGFLDDATMRGVMELSDAGFLPTKWEGFDLPLAEMQYVDCPMFVLNIGAHPEVAAHPYFLCETMEEMAGKISDFLAGRSTLSTEEMRDCFARFRKEFTWRRSAAEVMEAMQSVMGRECILLMDVTDACHDTANTGVMRVTRKVAAKLQERYATVFVLWDESIGGYVFPYLQEAKRLCSYGGPILEEIPVFSEDGQPRNTLKKILPEMGNRKKALLLTETVPHGKMRRVIPQMHQNGVRVGAIFYDAIAVKRPELVSKSVHENHVKYMMLLADCDFVLPIAKHNQQDLEEFWKERGLSGGRVTTVSLSGEMDGLPRADKPLPRKPEQEILFVSTLEPRKNHLRLLQAFEQLMESHPEMKVRLTMVGNQYAGNTEIPEKVKDYCRKLPNVRWLGVVDDKTLHKLYQTCTFTVYPSELEGYGMPIAESLWCGKPCLCSDKGSIGELGAPGGCLGTDILSVEAMASSLYRLLTDEAYYRQICEEAVRREIVTWDEYAFGIAGALSDSLLAPCPIHSQGWLDACIRSRIEEELRKSTGERVILCSNFYPPTVLGGAEIIAHQQGKALSSMGDAVFSFSIDSRGNDMEESCHMEDAEGIPVLRVHVRPDARDANGINFYSARVNALFEEYCRMIRPTVVHCHNISGMSMEIFAIARHFGAKVCLTLHDYWGFCLHNTLLDRHGEICGDIDSCSRCLEKLTGNGIQVPVKLRQDYMRRAFEKVDAFISPSEYLAMAYVRAGFPYRRMHVLWNGCSVENFWKVEHKPSKNLRISYVGFFGRHKGVDVLLRAVASLQIKNLIVHLVGDGCEKDAYRELANTLGISSQIRFWGKVANDEIGKVYAETDIYCLPSVWPENQPVTITEAMACGLPVIAPDLGGNRELVLDGLTGLLFRIGDERDLASKIRKLAEDPELRSRLGTKGRELMKDNDFSNQVKKLKEIYRMKESAVVPRAQHIIAFKGSKLPLALNQIRGVNFSMLEWVQKSKDWQQVIACVLLPDVSLTLEEREFLAASSKKILLPSKESSLQKAFGTAAMCYADEEDMLNRIRMLISPDGGEGAK